MKKKISIVVCLYICFSLLLFASASNYTMVNSGVSYQYIGTYSIKQLNEILTTQLSSDFIARPTPVKFELAQNSVKLYRVKYHSIIPEQNNKPTVASGLIAIPNTGKKSYPVVSYQHGTVFTKYEVPSNIEDSMETKLEVANFAGNGYILVAADYFGKGISSEPDSYMVKESTAQACFDMLKASQEVLNSMGISQTQLFLSGWSQGSWCTNVFRKRLETLSIPVTAAGMAATPNDPYLVMLRWIDNPSDSDAQWTVGCAALFVESYEHNYDLPGLTKEAVKPEYYQTVSDFYSNKVTWAQASKILPQHPESPRNYNEEIGLTPKAV